MQADTIGGTDAETIYRVFAWMYANRKWRFKDA